MGGVDQVRRVVLGAIFLLQIIIFVIFLVKVAGPFFAEAEALGVDSGPFAPAYTAIKSITYLLLVPSMLAPVVLWMVLGGAQDELQEERYRRRL